MAATISGSAESSLVDQNQLLLSNNEEMKQMQEKFSSIPMLSEQQKQQQMVLVPATGKSIVNRKWWKEAVVYQIYPRSFMDSNNDGIGDIPGITSKLDYLKLLGVDVIWLSPVYQSPNDDNGYDISDYRAIMKEFGTMDDWQRMVDEIHKRGMKLVMDLVLNHTSDEHEWFLKSRQSSDQAKNPYRDYYIWKKPKYVDVDVDSPDGSSQKKKIRVEPNNWISFFSGSAWQYDELTDEYYLHLFSKKQPDLNWENPRVREEIHSMIKYWLDKGVDGFRMDVINVISKVPGFPDAPVKDPGNQYHWAGEHFFNGPRLVEYLSQLKGDTFDKYDVFTVGETPGVTVELGQQFTCEYEGVLNMLFQFELMAVDIQEGKEKWNHRRWELDEIKRVMSRWQTGLHSGWNSLYLENHDQPRSLSRFGFDNASNDSNNERYRVSSAKMLGTWLHMMKGTPYIFQGQEIGMSNIKFSSIKDYRDLETLNFYNCEKQRGILSEEEIMRRIHLQSRDNARTPMQWNANSYAGFSSANPWIQVNPNYQRVNVEKCLQDPTSIFYHYQKLIRLRKEEMAIVYGQYELLHPDHPDVYCYVRSLNDEQILVLANFSGNTASFTFGEEDRKKIKSTSSTQCQLLISGDESITPSTIDLSETITLPPYETTVYKFSLDKVQSC